MAVQVASAYDAPRVAAPHWEAPWSCDSADACWGHKVPGVRASRNPGALTVSIQLPFDGLGRSANQHRRDAAGIRYIGSKARVVEEIAAILGERATAMGPS